MTHESTSAYFQWGPYDNNNNITKYKLNVKKKTKDVGKILVIMHNQGILYI